MNQQKISLFFAHLATLLFGMAGLFGKLVSLPAVIIVLGRVLFSSIFLFFIIRVRKLKISLGTSKEYFLIITAGAILALHWTAFMQSVQTSTVAVATLTFSTYPLFVTFLEPYIFHEKLKASSVICAIIMLIGVVFIVPEFELQNQMTQGVIWGMIGSLTYAVVSLLNRNFSTKYAGSIVSFYEQSVAAFILLPALFILRPKITGQDIVLLIFLGVVFTAIAHTLFIFSLKYIKVQTAGIISSLESVYGIAFASLILQEIPSTKEVIGGIIIMGVVFYTSITSTKNLE